MKVCHRSHRLAGRVAARGAGRRTVGFVLAAAVVLAAWAAAPAAAQDEKGVGARWWRSPRLSQRLGLSDEQVRQLDEAFRASRIAMIRIKSRVEEAQFELESLLESDRFSEETAMAQYRKLDEARSALGTERFRFLVKVRSIVGLETFRKLAEIKRARQQRRSGRRGASSP